MLHPIFQPILVLHVCHLIAHLPFSNIHFDVNS